MSAANAGSGRTTRGRAGRRPWETRQRRRGQLWLAKLILTFTGLFGLAAWCLFMGWSDRESEWAWVIGVWSGTAVVVAYLIGWSRRWFPDYREKAERGESRGRVYFPAGLIAASVVIYLGLKAGGDISTFFFAFSGAFLGTFAIWFMFHVPRNWEAVRARLGGSPT